MLTVTRRWWWLWLTAARQEEERREQRLGLVVHLGLAEQPPVQVQV